MADLPHTVPPAVVRSRPAPETFCSPAPLQAQLIPHQPPFVLNWCTSYPYPSGGILFWFVSWKKKKALLHYAICSFWNKDVALNHFGPCDRAAVLPVWLSLPAPSIYNHLNQFNGWLDFDWPYCIIWARGTCGFSDLACTTNALRDELQIRLPGRKNWLTAKCTEEEKAAYQVLISSLYWFAGV